MLDGNLAAFLIALSPWALIVALLNLRSPAAVVWRVWAVIVDAVESVAIRAWSHVGDESREIMDPFIGHGDSAPTPVGVSLMGGVIAPPLGVAPSLVLGGVSAAWLVSMLSGSPSGDIVFVTPATMSGATLQVPCAHVLHGTAFASACPVAVTPVLKGKGDNGPAVNGESDHV